MILPVVAYGDPVLREETKLIKKEDEQLSELIKNMFETMYHAKGMGLAAPQIGQSLRLFIIDTKQVSDKDEKSDEEGVVQTFINPEIIEKSGEEWKYEEGCLSIPFIHEDVIRPPKIVLRYFDEEFVEHEKSFEGMTARVIQHEFDHIQGILFVDYLKPLKKRFLKKKLESISKGLVDVEYKMRFPLLKR